MSLRDGDPLASDWDRLADRDDVDGVEPLVGPVEPPGSPAGDDGERPVPPLHGAAAAWGDLVAMLAVCTAALTGAALSGLPLGWRALPWGLAAGAAWWTAAAAVTVVVRAATPGMLLAGLRFGAAVPPGRVPRVLAVAAVQAVLCGLPAALAPARSGLLAWAAGSVLRPEDA